MGALRTEVDVKAGVVRIYYPDGTYEIVNIRSSIPEKYR